MRQKQLLSDEIKLIKLQITIDKNFRTNLTGKPLYATIGELIKANLGDEAEKLRKEFKISDSSEMFVTSFFLAYLTTSHLTTLLIIRKLSIN